MHKTIKNGAAIIIKRSLRSFSPYSRKVKLVLLPCCTLVNTTITFEIFLKILGTTPSNTFLLPLRYAIFSCLMTTRQKRTIPLLGQGKAITLSNFHSCEVELKRHKLRDTPVMFYVSFRHNCRIDLINAICAGRLYQLYNYFIYVYCFHSSGPRWDIFQFTIHQFYAIVKPAIILI